MNSVTSFTVQTQTEGVVLLLNSVTLFTVQTQTEVGGATLEQCDLVHSEDTDRSEWCCS